jgi:hypothetical protein
MPLDGNLSDVFVAAVLMVSFEVAGAPPDTGTFCGLNEQFEPAGSPEQASVTAATKPFCGVTVTVDKTELPAFNDTLVGETLREKLGTPTIRLTVALWLVLDPVPVTVTL